MGFRIVSQSSCPSCGIDWHQAAECLCISQVRSKMKTKRNETIESCFVIETALEVTTYTNELKLTEAISKLQEIGKNQDCNLYKDEVDYAIAKMINGHLYLHQYFVAFLLKKQGDFIRNDTFMKKNPLLTEKEE